MVSEGLSRWLLALSLIGLGGVALPSGAAHAWSCAELTIGEAFEQSDAAFIGRLTEVRRSPLASTSAPARWVFDVDTVFRGDVFETQSIVSAVSGSSRGLELPMNTPVVVFGREEPGLADLDPVDGEYSSSLCDGNTVLSSAATEALGDGVVPLAGTSPIGRDSSRAAMIVRYRFVVIGLVAGAAGIAFTARRPRAEQRALGEAGP